MSSYLYKTLVISFLIVSLVSCDLQDSSEDEVLSNHGIHIIFSVNPSSGPEGSIVTIEGMHFSEVPEANKVFFNGGEAEVLQGTAQLLKVRVPEGARSGKITVKINENTSMSPNEFIVEQ